MNKQFKLVPIPIQYHDDDELLHTEANGYRCGTPGCPCSDLPSFSDTQRMLLSFAASPGTLSRIDAVMQRRKITSHLEEETPTLELDPMPQELETFMIARTRRRHRTFWQRLFRK